MTRHTQKRPVAKGVLRPDGTLGVVVHLPEDTFNEVRDRAIAEGTSWGEQAHQLIEWGLETAREDAS